MSSRRSLRQLLVAVLLGVLVGGGLMAVTPAGAEVSSAVATNWKKIWKKNLKPLADRRYYKKSQSDAKYATKAESAAGDAAANAATDSKLGGYYKKTESDAKYAGAGSSYTKAESDAKYAPTTKLLRGNYLLLAPVSGGGQWDSASISFGDVIFSARPTVHVIPVAGAVPAGCSGSAAAPNAAPGNLCIFESARSNVSSVSTCSAAPYNCASATAADTWGFGIYAVSTAGGQINATGTWAARPAAIAAPPAARPGTSDGVNRVPGGSGPQ